MKKLLFLFLFLVSLNLNARVRTGEPRYHVTGVVVVDSIEYVRYSFDFGRNAVVSSDCGCVVNRRSAIRLFGFDSLDYVKPKDLPVVYSILSKL